MTGPSTVWLVATREIRQRLRAKSFTVFTVILCVAILAIGVLQRVQSGSDAKHYDIVVAGAAPSGFADALTQAGAAFGVEIDTETGSVDSARNRVADGSVDAAVLADEGEAVFEDDPPDDLGRILDAAWAAATAAQLAADAGLDQSTIEGILQPPPLRREVLEPPDDDENLGRLVGVVSAVLLFMSINFLGAAVLSGVVEEKTTAVVEVLLARVRPHQLLAGKVAGIGTVGLLQFAAAVASGLVSLKVSGTSVPAEIWVAVPTMLFWFLGGFALYSTLFALGGSFVSRQEDAQGAVMPISISLTGAYILMFTFIATPGVLLARVLSVLPPFAPLLMPLRIATGSASVLEIVAAAVLLIAGVVAMLRLAGRVYAHTLLHRGSRLGWRQALRSIGASN